MQSIHSGFGCFLLDLAPFCCWFSVCLLSDETQVWLGDLLVVVCGFVLHFYFCQNRASGNIGRTGGGKKKLTMSRKVFSTFADLSVTLLAAPCHVQRRCPCGPIGIAALLCCGQTTGGGSIPRWSASKPQVW